MRKKVSAAIAVLLIFSLLTGCAGSTTSSVTESSGNSTSASQSESQTESVSDAESESSDDEEAQGETSQSATQTTAVTTTVNSANQSAPESEKPAPETSTTTSKVSATEGFSTPKPEVTTKVTAESTDKPAAVTSTTTKAVTTTKKPSTTTTKAATTTTKKAVTTTTKKPATTTTTTAYVPDPDDSPVMQQYKEKQATIEKQMSKIENSMTTPSIYITTYNKQQILSKDFYVDSVIDVFNCDEQYRLTAEGGVKVRGNSTAEGNEKPYRIKFEKKQNMLGLHEGEKFKSWVLLKSNWNLVMDYTAFELAKEIFAGEYYSSDCTFVNVYINGSYKGIYVLCEQNQAAEGRVEVYEPEKDETQNEIGYFLELDNYANEEEDPFFTLDYDGITFTDFVGTTRMFEHDNYSIKSETNTQGQRDFIANYIDGVFMIMYEAIENNNLLMFDENYNLVSAEGVYTTAEQAVSAVIDVDSFVNTMILQELVHNYDVGAGSFYMAVDFSENSKYEKLTFLAPWDFNWAYNDETHGRYYAGVFQQPVHDMYERSNYWLTVIMKADWFREKLKDKWAVLENGSALGAPLTRVLKAAQALKNDLGYESYKIDSAKEVIMFVRGRVDWLNSQWKR